MTRALLLLGMGFFGLLSCSRAPESGAIQLRVTFSGFRPGCVQVLASDGQNASNTQKVDIPVGAESATTLYVAVFRPTGWSDEIQLNAFGFERQCTGTPVAEKIGPVVRFAPRDLRQTVLLLSATDADADGFVPKAARGTDCNDADPNIRPGAPEVCDGVDNNCSGEVDEGCLCVGGAVRSCYDGPPGTQGVGFCVAGKQTCTNGEWSACAGQTLPGTESCNDGFDEDCDGQSDEGCPCSANSSQSCYSGPRDTAGVGICKAGTQSCANGTWGACTGSVPPSAEACDLTDNDCNGAADDSVPPQPCYTFDGGTPGVGACKSGGRPCVNGAFADCENQTGPRAETCDNVDNNCDGTVDNFTQACFPFESGNPGVGVCKAGTQQCTAGVLSSCTGSVGPSAEVCDGKDNDCNGQVDNGVTTGTCVGPNNCAGVSSCDGDGGVRCTPSQTASEWFLDDDEDQRGSPDSGVLSCGSPGARYVANKDDCDDGDPFTYLGMPEQCDDKDNDCNGTNGDLQAGGACMGTTWRARADTDPGEWATVVSPRAGDVYILGNNNRAGARFGGAFTLTGTACTGAAGLNWSTASVVPGANDAFLGTTSGQLAYASINAGTCTLSQNLAPGGGSIAGLRAFNTAGTLEAYGITASGAFFRFRPPSTVEVLPPLANVTLRDLHGTAPSNLFAVGQVVTTGQPYIARFNGTSWSEQTLPPGLTAGTLTAVWAVNDRLAVAVGANMVVLRLQNGSWSRLASPPITGGNRDLSSVVAFGANSIYATDATSVRRYTQAGWNTPVTVGGGVLLTDIAGVSPADLWVTGTKGTVIHWHE